MIIHFLKCTEKSEQLLKLLASSPVFFTEKMKGRCVFSCAWFLAAVSAITDGAFCKARLTLSHHNR